MLFCTACGKRATTLDDTLDHLEDTDHAEWSANSPLA